MTLHDEFARKIASLEQEIADLRAIHAQMILKQANVIPFPARLRCEPDCRAFAAPCDQCPDGAA